MDKTGKNSLLIIVASAFLVVLLFNYKYFIWAMELIQSEGLSALDERIRPRFIYMGVTSLFHILLFLITGLFNFTWKDRLVPGRWHHAVRIACIILLNGLIFFGLACIEMRIFNGLWAIFDKRADLMYVFFVNISVFGVAAAIAYFLILLRRIRTTELENVRLRQEKSSAELAALKEQISPHFLFNTLNSLSAVIRTENKSESLDFVQNLSLVYRYILDSRSCDTVTVSEELAFLNAYRYLLRKRFGNHLQVEIRVEHAWMNHRIPPMALQVLIENVVKHNQISSRKPVIVRIENREHFLVVENNIERKMNAGGHGMGLANLNKRYRMIAERELIIESDETKFTVKLPVLEPQP